MRLQGFQGSQAAAGRGHSISTHSEDKYSCCFNLNAHFKVGIVSSIGNGEFASNVANRPELLKIDLTSFDQVFTIFLSFKVLSQV